MIRNTFQQSASGSQSGASFGESARWRIAIVFAVAGLLCACAGGGPYREGNALLAAGKTDEGLAKLEEAVRLEPSNAEYRIALYGQRMALVNRLVTAAENARRD